MNKFLKSALVVAGVAGAFSAAEANAVSLTVVIDKIEIVKDADNYPNTATTIFEPRSSIGESATKTVDLFDATEKLGTAYTLRKPSSGEYESLLVTFSEIKAVSGSSEVDLLAQYKTAGILSSTGTNGTMVFGNIGSGAASVGTILTATSIAPMQPIIANGSSDVTLPTLDFYLPSSTLVANGSSIALTQFPRPVLSASQATDSASIANVIVDVDANTAFTSATGWTLDASVVTVGLFDNTVPETPLVSTTFTAVTPTVVKQVTFIDAPRSESAEIYPIAWIDLDGNGNLDKDEYYTVAETVRANNGITISGTADISASDVLIVEGATNGILDVAGLTFPGRTISITVEMANAVSASAASDCAAAGDIATDTGLTANAAALSGVAGVASCGTATNSSVTVIYAMNSAGTISQSVELATYLATGSGANSTIDATDDVDVLLKNTTQFDSMGNVSYFSDTATSGRVLITGVPAFDTAFASDLNGATYAAAAAINWGSSGGSSAPETDTTTIGSAASADATIAVGASVGNTTVIDSSATVDFGTFN